MKAVRHPKDMSELVCSCQDAVNHHVSGIYHDFRSIKSIPRSVCSQCFKDVDDENGVDVCLSCLNCSCREHSIIHAGVHSHQYVLNITRMMKKYATTTKDITKLAIGVEGGAIDTTLQDNFDYYFAIECKLCGRKFTLGESTNQTEAVLSEVAAAIICVPEKYQGDGLGSSPWEEAVLVDCQHLQTIERKEQIQMVNRDNKCSLCSMTDNLWLCLVCGHIGCGRRQFDLTGICQGNGHALQHFEETGHACTVKLGTITSFGTGDAFCYGCDLTVEDTNLIDHLASLGMDVGGMKKTEATMGERMLEQNKMLDFSKSYKLDEFEPLYGGDNTGIQNIGNSCYMNSIFQVILRLDKFISEYADPMKMSAHVRSCTTIPHRKCFQCQIRRAAVGLTSGECTPSNEEEASTKKGISLEYLYDLIQGEHHQFGDGRQHDAVEYFQFLIKKMEEFEKNNDIISKLFSFELEQKLTCLGCYKVRYDVTEENIVTLPLPQIVGEEGTSLSKCIEEYYKPTLVSFNCPSCMNTASATLEFRFKTFPRVLALGIGRIVLNNLLFTKSDANVRVPLEMRDVSQLQAISSSDFEQLLPREGNDSAPGGPSGAGLSLQQSQLVEEVMAMGFPRVSVVNAMKKIKEPQESFLVIDYLLNNGGDPDLEDPPEELLVEADKENVAIICSMGYPEVIARKGLVYATNNVAVAIDWIEAHPNIVEKHLGEPEEKIPDLPLGLDIIENGYRLHAVVCHKGQMTDMGHYVSLIRRELSRGEDEWVMFNDRSVYRPKEGVDVNKLVEEGYIFFYIMN